MEGVIYMFLKFRLRLILTKAWSQNWYPFFRSNSRRKEIGSPTVQKEQNYSVQGSSEKGFVCKTNLITPII